MHFQNALYMCSLWLSFPPLTVKLTGFLLFLFLLLKTYIIMIALSQNYMLQDHLTVSKSRSHKLADTTRQQVRTRMSVDELNTTVLSCRRKTVSEGFGRVQWEHSSGLVMWTPNAPSKRRCLLLIIIFLIIIIKHTLETEITVTKPHCATVIHC